MAAQVGTHVVHGLCFIGDPANPDSGWLAIQQRKPKSNAVWRTAYPVSGGAITADMKNDMSDVREATQHDLYEARKHNDRCFNPAMQRIDTIFFS